MYKRQDIWKSDVCNNFKKEGADIIISPNGSPYDRYKRDLRIKTAVERVKENSIPLIYVNQVGGQDELVFDGGSFVVSETGEIIYQAIQFEEEVFHLDIELLIKGVSDKSNLELRVKSLELENIVSSIILLPGIFAKTDRIIGILSVASCGQGPVLIDTDFKILPGEINIVFLFTFIL